MKRLRGTVGGSQLLYVPILPKPFPTISASNSVGGESSKNVGTSVAMPTNCQLPASDMTGIDLSQLLYNTPALDLSSSSIVVAQTKSTTPVQISGNMVAQRPLSTVTFVDESRSPVSTSGNSTVQGPSPASATVSGTKTIPPLHSSGNVVPQNQLPLSTIVPQTASLQSSVCATKQNQLPMLATVSQIASSEPFQTFVNTVPQGQLGNALMSPFQIFGNMAGQDQSQTFGTAEVPDANMEQPISGTPSQITSWNLQQGVGEFSAILEAPGALQVDDAYSRVNTNMLRAAYTGFQMTNRDIGDFHPNIVSDSIATQPPNSSGLDASNMLNDLNLLAEYAFAMEVQYAFICICCHLEETLSIIYAHILHLCTHSLVFLFALIIPRPRYNLLIQMPTLA